MKNLIRVLSFVTVTILLFSAPNAFAIDDCKVCKGRVLPGGGVYIGCDRASYGGLGAEYCFVDDDGQGGAYCYTLGDWCCITGPAY